MKIDPIHLKYNRFIRDYRQQTDQMKAYFEYNPFSSFEKRLDYLDKNEYQRKELVEALQEMNKNWGADTAVHQNIKRLESKNSVVVIGSNSFSGSNFVDHPAARTLAQKICGHFRAFENLRRCIHR